MSITPPTWRELLEALGKCKTEEQVQAIIDKEKAGPNRLRWIVRAKGRFNVLRAQRENLELGSKEEA